MKKKTDKGFDFRSLGSRLVPVRLSPKHFVPFLNQFPPIYVLPESVRDVTR